jgi:hypothetical protein
MAFLCVSQQGELQNTMIFLWNSPCQKPFTKKVKGISFFPLEFPPFDFFNRVFGRFST